MRSHLSRARFAAYGAIVSAALAAFAGCAGGSDTPTQPTTAPATPAPASSGDFHRGHRHRHRHHGQTANAAVSNVPPQPASSGAYPCDDAAFVTMQQQYATGALQGDREVDVCGTVAGVRTSHVTRSGLHGYYDLKVASGDTIEIVCDLGQMNAPAWPWVDVGDYSYVRGRYYFDSPSSQGIDWTHHGTSHTWPSAGYVVVAGKQYR